MIEESRRALVHRVLVLVALLCGLASCIFDESDYKGGGRRGSRTANVEDSGEPAETDSGTPIVPETGAPDTGGNPLPDTGAGGG